MIAEPNCSLRGCIHFLGLKKEAEGIYTPLCRAYPQGIPSNIAYGSELHLRALPGDHGFQFSSKVEEGGKPSKFVDTDLDSIIVYDSDGNPIL